MKTLGKILCFLFEFVRGVLFGLGVAAGASFIMLCLIAIKFWIWG